MGDRAQALGLADVFLAAAIAAGRAVERTSDRLPTIALGIDRSLPLNYSDDRLNNPAGRTGRADYLTSPYLRLSIDGKLRPDLSYSFYASGAFDK